MTARTIATLLLVLALSAAACDEPTSEEPDASDTEEVEEGSGQDGESSVGQDQQDGDDPADEEGQDGSPDGDQDDPDEDGEASFEEVGEAGAERLRRQFFLPEGARMGGRDPRVRTGEDGDDIGAKFVVPGTAREDVLAAYRDFLATDGWTVVEDGEDADGRLLLRFERDASSGALHIGERGPGNALVELELEGFPAE